jgi:outer membrane protein assembly factor BamB
MLQHHPRIRAAAPGLLAAAVLVVLLTGDRPALAIIDAPAETLAKECAVAENIAVLRVEKVNREKKGIVYSKVRDLKGSFPAPFRFPGDTFTHVLGPTHNPDYNRLDAETQGLQNDAILAWAAEGKTAVIFDRGGNTAVCVGHAWYTVRGRPPAQGHWVVAGSADSRFQRLFCGTADELAAAVTDILAGKEVTVPLMIGNEKMVTDRTGPVRGNRADKVSPLGGFYSPFHQQLPWSTHRGNAQHTGADGGPGPKEPKVLWAYQSKEHFIAPLVPNGDKEVFASCLGSFNAPGLHALALDPAAVERVRWSKAAPVLDRPIVAAPALYQGHTSMLFVGDGMHQSDRAGLSCLRAGDGFPLWRLPVPGKLVHFEATPTVTMPESGAGPRSDRPFGPLSLFAGGGSAGVLCVNPSRVTLEGKDQDLVQATGVLEQRWKELLAKYEEEKKKDPVFALPPDESMLPKSTPKLLWQQGRDEWHVDAPVAVVDSRVLAASAYPDDEKTGERALVCLKAGDGELLWKTPLKFNPWAGPTVGPYVLVGCSSIRLDPKAIADARGEVVAVELDTGKVRWRNDVPGGVLSSVAVKEGLAVFTATDGKVRAWDAFTGQERWTYEAGTPFFAGPAVTGKVVYAADLKGVVHAINLADGKKQWTLDLAADPATKAPGMVYGSPVVHGGRLYLATCNLGDGPGKENVVVCIGEK